MRITYELAAYVPMNFLPDALVKEHEFSRFKAGHIIAFYGMSQVVGAILSGICANYLKNNLIQLNLICMIGLGASCVGMAFSSVYWHFVVCFFIHGIFNRKYIVLTPISLIEMFGVESLHASFSVIMACSGIASLIGLPMFGWFKELKGTYDFVFIVAGGFHVLGGTLALILLWLHKRK